MMNFELKVCRRFDRVVTVGNDDRDLLTSFGLKNQSAIIPNGVDLEYFSPEDNQEVDELVFVGYFGHGPNKDGINYFCSDIFPLIKDKFPHIKLKIIGKDPEGDIESLMSDNIEILGWVNDIRPHLRRSKVFIVPIRYGSGMRTKILEAMGMGKAIVSTTLGCENIDVAGGRDILIADSPDEFANSVIRLLGNASLRKEIGRNARDLVEKKYSWDAIAEEQQRVYEELLKC